MPLPLSSKALLLLYEDYSHVFSVAVEKQPPPPSPLLTYYSLPQPPLVILFPLLEEVKHLHFGLLLKLHMA